VDPEKVRLKIDRGETVSRLEIDIEIPTPMQQSLDRSASAAHLR
jgi:hypothetical protein